MRWHVRPSGRAERAAEGCGCAAADVDDSTRELRLLRVAAVTRGSANGGVLANSFCISTHSQNQRGWSAMRGGQRQPARTCLAWYKRSCGNPLVTTRDTESSRSRLNVLHREDTTSAAPPSSYPF